MRKIAGKAVPQYLLHLGGDIGPEGAVFGRLSAKIPARYVPVALERLIDLYAAEKKAGERPEDFFARVPLDTVKPLLKDLNDFDAAQATEQDFIDLGETKAFEVVLAEGECAA